MSYSPVVLESEMNIPAKNCFRLVVLGAPKVGKTAIVNRFLNGKYTEQYTPTIEDFHRKIYKIKGDVYRLDILDTSGNNPFPAMHRLSILTGDVFILAYSIDNRDTYHEVLRLRENIVETFRANKGIKAVPMVIAGNKSDHANREIPTEEAKKAFSYKRCSFVETSAKKNLHIDTLFRHLFENARMPSEMSPSLHRKVSASSPPNLTPRNNQRALPMRRKISEACGVISPHARRPSLRSDLINMRNSVVREDDEDDEVEVSGTTVETVTQGKPKKKSGCIIQ